jgi:hypothetical protein
MSHALSGFLTDLQRRPVPGYDRRAARWGMSAGGAPQQHQGPFVEQNGMVNEVTRERGRAFDGAILRDRGPWMHAETMTPPPVTWISWTKAGPIRPELHVSNTTYRVRGGTSATRYPVVDSPTTGRHTAVPNAANRSASRYAAVPQMIPPRKNRLRPGQYSGQTYSQLTRIQGR